MLDTAGTGKVVSQVFTHVFLQGLGSQPPQTPLVCRQTPGSPGEYAANGPGAPALAWHEAPSPDTGAGPPPELRALRWGSLLLLSRREGTHRPGVGMNPRHRDGPVSLARSENSHSWKDASRLHACNSLTTAPARRGAHRTYLAGRGSA